MIRGKIGEAEATDVNPEGPRPPAEKADVPARAHSEDGVDLTLIRWMLSLTPVERLQVLQDNVNSLLELRSAAGITDIAP